MPPKTKIPDHKRLAKTLGNVTPEQLWFYRAARLRLSIVKKFAQQRESKGLTQDELAEALGTKQSWVSRFLSGRDLASPTLETLVRVAGVLGGRVTLDFIEDPDLPGHTFLKPYESAHDMTLPERILVHPSRNS